MIISLLLLPSIALAFEIPGYEGGVQNEMVYQEVIFVTGEPILMRGTLSISVSERNNTRSERYTYKLENVEKEAKLERSVTLAENITENRGQITSEKSISKYGETITINGIRYETTEKSHQWSQATITQKKPGVDYYVGDWTGRKTYTINRTQGTVVVETQGHLVGYHQPWGTTEAQTLEHFITYETVGEEPIKWQGRATVEAVHNSTKDYEYVTNTPTQISFYGGYLLTEKQENILKYSYDLPRLGQDGKVLSQRNLGQRSLSLETNPNIRRLNIPAMRDVIGHWAEKEILLLASMDALPLESTYFGPSLPMTRGDFAKAIAIVMDIEEKIPPTTRATRGRTQAQPEPPTFVDVSREHPHSGYIEAIYERGIMEGVGDNQFRPQGTLTKAQAAATIVRLLGFENLAPIQSYSTGFRDERQIPSWAKDSVYVARELNLITGTTDGYFQPNKEITKAEAAKIITNLINYLQRDLRYDYRERILNY